MEKETLVFEGSARKGAKTSSRVEYVTIVKNRISKTLTELIAEVNPVIMGWKNYFVRCGYPNVRNPRVDAR